MNIEQIVFYVFSALAILGASLVVFAKNPVKAVLCLVFTFFSTAGLWMLLESEFLSVILVLVYVGAVMVLFLFVVMMLDVELASVRAGFTRYLPLGLCVSVLVVVGLVYAVGSKNFGLDRVPMPAPYPENYSHIEQLGSILYSRFLYPFELAGILLLVSMVAAISLTFRGRRENKAPQPSEQVLVNKEIRVRIVKMETWKNNP